MADCTICYYPLIATTSDPRSEPAESSGCQFQCSHDGWHTACAQRLSTCPVCQQPRKHRSMIESLAGPAQLIKTELFHDCLKLKDQNLPVVYLLPVANAYLRLGAYDEAYKAVETVLKDPSLELLVRANALRLLANVELCNEKRDKFNTHMALACRLDPAKSYFFDFLGSTTTFFAWSDPTMPMISDDRASTCIKSQIDQAKRVNYCLP